MKRVFHVIPLLLAMLGSIVVARAQTVVITKVSLNAPPTASTARAYAFGANGALQSMGTTEVNVTEDGNAVASQIACDPASGGRNISLLVAADVSASSKLGTPSINELERAAAIAANGALGSASDEIGLVEFDQRAFVLLGLTTGRTAFDAAARTVSGSRSIDTRWPDATDATSKSTNNKNHLRIADPFNTRFD